MLKIFFLYILIFFQFKDIISKEIPSKLCYKRGVEVILPYEFAVSEIKKNSSFSEEVIKKELRNYKKMFENSFFGLNLYESTGCSKARLSEYLECLIETDGRDCKIYYTQMRLVD
jgi:hypothetical protein